MDSNENSKVNEGETGLDDGSAFTNLFELAARCDYSTLMLELKNLNFENKTQTLNELLFEIIVRSSNKADCLPCLQQVQALGGDLNTQDNGKINKIL